MREEPCITYGISVLFVGVLLPVDFDRELSLWAPKVRNVTVDKRPVSKLDAEPLATQ